MAWQTPKTDWAVRYDTGGNYIGDYFNAEDYHRIKANLVVLRDWVNTMYLPVELPAVPDVSAVSYFYEAAINALERSLDVLRNGTDNVVPVATKTWYGNDNAPLAVDLNRIEAFCLALYKILDQQEAALPKLAFVLGGVQF